MSTDTINPYIPHPEADIISQIREAVRYLIKFLSTLNQFAVNINIYQKNIPARYIYTKADNDTHYSVVKQRVRDCPVAYSMYKKFTNELPQYLKTINDYDEDDQETLYEIEEEEQTPEVLETMAELKELFLVMMNKGQVLMSQLETSCGETPEDKLYKSYKYFTEKLLCKSILTICAPNYIKDQVVEEQRKRKKFVKLQMRAANCLKDIDFYFEKYLAICEAVTVYYGKREELMNDHVKSIYQHLKPKFEHIQKHYTEVLINESMPFLTFDPRSAEESFLSFREVEIGIQALEVIINTEKTVMEELGECFFGMFVLYSMQGAAATDMYEKVLEVWNDYFYLQRMFDEYKEIHEYQFVNDLRNRYAYETKEAGRIEASRIGLYLLKLKEYPDSFCVKFIILMMYVYIIHVRPRVSHMVYMVMSFDHYYAEANGLSYMAPQSTCDIMDFTKKYLCEKLGAVLWVLVEEEDDDTTIPFGSGTRRVRETDNINLVGTNGFTNIIQIVYAYNLSMTEESKDYENKEVMEYVQAHPTVVEWAMEYLEKVGEPKALFRNVTIIRNGLEDALDWDGSDEEAWKPMKELKREEEEEFSKSFYTQKVRSLRSSLVMNDNDEQNSEGSEEGSEEKSESVEEEEETGEKEETFTQGKNGVEDVEERNERNETLYDNKNSTNEGKKQNEERSEKGKENITTKFVRPKKLKYHVNAFNKYMIVTYDDIVTVGPKAESDQFVYLAQKRLAEKICEEIRRDNVELLKQLEEKMKREEHEKEVEEERRRVENIRKKKALEHKKKIKDICAHMEWMKQMKKAVSELPEHIYNEPIHKGKLPQKEKRKTETLKLKNANIMMSGIGRTNSDV
ncbi:hypothetical protein EIN_258820 [Entamoeba invadens IP1]|uniref:Uncharacterized protein n=1 Tax=Entamoeba invadens IP1 TaxID=370355 RepID=A0A0A1TZX8_ENTIV|nr:hypothetical protein EIN_258820 [Entamoeba invadens IP1]ELP84198.1 hypothetical protein EIN_258820 [Entamoeba invadens IP1]|eukprot:XP_004183544.1 hypothetical protein EIN_258820 [Entamoeba invadens IP1]